MKRILAFITAFLIFAVLAIPAFASDAKQQITQITLEGNIPFETCLSENIGATSIKSAIQIDGITNYLYPTFDDIDEALKNLEKTIPTYYGYIKDTVDLRALYGVDYNQLLSYDISPKNPAIDELDEAIRNGSINCKGTPLMSEQQALAEEREIFSSFLDIYENESVNKTILSLLNVERTDAVEEELAYLLPYTCPFVESYFAELHANRAPQVFNKTLGRQYAINYATNPNSSEYGIAMHWYTVPADCTNFASQILVAGNINMHDYYPNETQGWWHRKVKEMYVNSYVWKHYYSNTWVGADRFVRFMGHSNNVYTSFPTFASKLMWGDFIALDKENDGSWNHMGFVCDIGSYGTYTYTKSGVQYSLYYRNFRVAQHTDNYLAWANSEINKWDEYHGTGKYAIVRRNYTI